MIKLYTFPPSTNSRKVRIALLEKGLEFQRINVDLSKKGTEKSRISQNSSFRPSSGIG